MIKVENLRKDYGEIEALKGITFQTPNKGMVFVVGKSGSGKSTLLHLIGGLDQKTSGHIEYNFELEAETIRNPLDLISFVFQDHNLINDFSVVDNLNMFGCRDEIVGVLNRVGLNESYLYRKIDTLSGGERQRIAIARGLLKESKILLLDEPTGNLDSFNAHNIYSLLKDIAKEKLVIIVTHQMEYAKQYGNQIIELDSGQVIRHETIHSDRYIVDEVTISNELAYVFNFLVDDNTTQWIEFELIDQNKLSQKYRIHYQDLMVQLVHIFNEYQQNKLIFKKIEQETVQDKRKNISSKQVNFSVYHQFKFAMNLMKINYKKLFLTMCIYLISFSLLFSYLNIILVSKSSILTNAYQSSKLDMMTLGLEECNSYINECEVYYKGKRLYHHLIKTFGKEHVLFYDHEQSIEIDTNRIPMTIQIITEEHLENLSKREIIGKLPKGKEDLLISDYLAYLLFGQSDDSVIGLTVTINEMDFIISGVFKTDYNKRDIIRISLDDKLKDLYSDYFFYQYESVLMTKEAYLEFIIPSSLSLRGANFYYSDLATSYYMSHRLTIEYKKNPILLWGRMPEEENEIIISSDFAKRYFQIDHYDHETIDEFLNVYSFKNIEASMHYVSYQEYPNLYHVFPNGVKIVGIYESEHNNPSFIPMESKFKEVKEEVFYSHISGFNLLMDEEVTETISMVVQNDYIINNRMGRVATLFIEFFEGSFSRLLRGILYVLLALSTLILYSHLSSIIRLKKRELGILKSLGINNQSIVNIFLIYNGLQWSGLILFSTVIGSLMIQLVNYIMKSHDVLNIDFALFKVHYQSLIYMMIISLIVLIVSILLPFFNLMKLTPIEAIRDHD